MGALELVNEPKREDSGDTQWMVEHYYGSAIDAVREAEATLGVSDAAKLHLAVMDDLWYAQLVPLPLKYPFCPRKLPPSRRQPSTT